MLLHTAAAFIFGPWSRRFWQLLIRLFDLYLITRLRLAFRRWLIAAFCWRLILRRWSLFGRWWLWRRLVS